MTLTHEWQEYDMDYQKAVQDIRTKDGKEYLNCWPNAGEWAVMAKERKDCIQVPDSEVTHVRLNESWMSEEEELAGEAKTRERGIGIRTVKEQEPFVLHNPYLEEDNMKLIDYPYQKQHKPNKGFKLGGYRYKGR